LPSNISPQPNQQLEEYLICLKIALEANDFEALEQLVNDHPGIMDGLNDKIHQEAFYDANFLQKSYNDIASLLIEAQRMKEELCWSLRVVGMKKKQIAAYVKSQF
jgi:hypothetical protein